MARFNVTAESLSEGKDAVVYFEGTPIPTSVRGRLDHSTRDLHPLVLLFVLSGTLMVRKTLRIQNF